MTVTDAFNVTRLDWAWADRVGVHGALVSDMNGYASLTIVDDKGRRLGDAALVQDADADLSVAFGLALASDGSRFAALFVQQSGVPEPLIRFRLFDSSGRAASAPVDMESRWQWDGVGSILATATGWVMAWAGQEPEADAAAPNALRVAQLGADGSSRGLPTSVTTGHFNAIRLAATSAGALGLAWSDVTGVHFMSLSPDMQPVSTIMLFPPDLAGDGGPQIFGTDSEFVVSLPSANGTSMLARVDAQGRILCGPLRVSVATHGFAHDGAAVVGVGARVIDQNTQSVQLFEVLDDCSLASSRELTRRTGPMATGGVLAGTPPMLLAAWVEYVVQEGFVQALPVDLRCLEAAGP